MDEIIERLKEEGCSFDDADIWIILLMFAVIFGFGIDQIEDFEIE